MTPVKPVEAELLVVTGMSGAGRSTASDALEDHGWYVVENLPPQMLGTLAELVSRTPHSMSKLAVVMDVRSKELFADIRTALRALERQRRHLPGAVPGRQRRRRWSAASSRAAGPTRCRAGAGSWTASPPSGNSCANSGTPPTSSWTPPN